MPSLFIAREVLILSESKGNKSKSRTMKGEEMEENVPRKKIKII